MKERSKPWGAESPESTTRRTKRGQHLANIRTHGARKYPSGSDRTRRRQREEDNQGAAKTHTNATIKKREFADTAELHGATVLEGHGGAPLYKGFTRTIEYLSGEEGVVEKEKPHKEHADPLLLLAPLALRPSVYG